VVKVPVSWQKAASPPHMDGSTFSLQCVAPHTQNCPFRWWIWTLSNTWFLGPPESTSQMTSRSGQPFLQGSWSWQTNRPCYQRSITIGRIYIVLRCSLKKT